MDEAIVKSAIETILKDKPSYYTSLNYAVGYCREALNMTGEALRTQVLYILNNIKGWRGPGSKDARKILKDFVKEG